MEDWLYGKILVISNNDQESNEIFYYLNNWGLEAYECKNHLHALTYMEDEEFDTVLVCSNYEDIDGLEFCRLVRRREKENTENSIYTYLILIGNEEERLSIIESDFWDVDDFIIRPFLFAELRWRLGTGLKKLRKYKKLYNNQQIVYGQDVLNKNGLYSYILSELNRSWRANGQMCLLLVHLKGLELAGLNYGDEWVAWLDNYLVGTMNKNLRDYDKVGIVGRGVWCLVISDTSRQGLEGLISRLKKDMQNFLQSSQIVQLSNIELAFHGILINLELADYQNIFAFDRLWEWLINKAQDQDIEERIVTAKLDGEGLKLQDG